VTSSCSFLGARAIRLCCLWRVQRWIGTSGTGPQGPFSSPGRCRRSTAGVRRAEPAMPPRSRRSGCSVSGRPGRLRAPPEPTASRPCGRGSRFFAGKWADHTSQVPVGRPFTSPLQSNSLIWSHEQVIYRAEMTATGNSHQPRDTTMNKYIKSNCQKRPNPYL
jgi:hypothetical protein